MKLGKLTKKSKTARRQRAVLLVAMRQRKPMKWLLTLASINTIKAVLTAYPRLHRYYRGDAAPRAYRWPPRPPAPNHIKAMVERELWIALKTPADQDSCGKIALAQKILAMWRERKKVAEMNAHELWPLESIRVH